jgi:Gpi18-like mannosyltransferase
MPARIPHWINLNVVLTVLISKSLILIFGAQAFLTVGEKPFNAYDTFLGIWARWDAAQYLKIAQDGYVSTGDDRFLIVFFPLYPLLTAMTETVIRDYLLSAFIVTGVASLAAALSLRSLVRLDHAERTAQLAVIFLFIFPTSYFLHIPYTESLFLALVIGSFVAARKRAWLFAGFLGALACLTRVNGLIIFPALLFEVLVEFREVRRFDRNWLFLLLIPIGFCGYLAINYFVTGDAFMFLTYQREHWYRYFRWPWEGIWETFKRIDNPKVVDAQMTGIHEILFVFIGAVATVFGWRYLRNSYRVWMVANWLLFVSTSFVLSVPRYTLTMFPLFILMAIAARSSKPVKFGFGVWSILYLALFTTQFVRGNWAF